MTAAIWSTPPDKCALDFPAYTLVGVTSLASRLASMLTSYVYPCLVPDTIHAQSSPATDHRQTKMAYPPWRQVIAYFSNPYVPFSHSIPSSRTYVDKILSTLPSSRFHLSTPIKSLRSTPASNKPGQAHTVQLTTASGETLEFDHVILACHTDTTVNILNAGGGMTAEEARILEAFKWNKNEAVLHCDEQVSPFHRHSRSP